MKHLIKGLAFFVGFNALLILGVCWYNFLLGNGFNLRNLSTDGAQTVVVCGFLVGGAGFCIIYFLSLDNDN